MKNLLKLTLLAIVFALGSCSDDTDEESDGHDLLAEPVVEKTVIIEGKEYLQVKVQMYCGHQYTHHLYYSRMLIPK